MTSQDRKNLDEVIQDLEKFDRLIDGMCELREEIVADPDAYFKKNPQAMDFFKDVPEERGEYAIDPRTYSKHPIKQDFKDFKWSTSLPKEEADKRLREWRERMNQDQEKISQGTHKH